MLQKENDNETKYLTEEILELKKQLLWYKRTYEDRSLAGIIYDRLKKKKLNFPKIDSLNHLFRFNNRVQISLSPNASQLPLKILCSIVNHNESINAQNLHKVFSQYFDTIVLDSGSTNPPRNSLKFKNIYYSGLLNESWKMAKKNNYDYLFLVCSDVNVGEAEGQSLFFRLKSLDYEQTGIYSPSSKGGYHFFCKKQTDHTLRVVPFVEGFIFLCDIQLLDCLCPIDTNVNLYGWGLDIAKGFYARQSNKLCYIDDSIEVEHKTGTGYSRETAEFEMLSWMKGLNNPKLSQFLNEQLQISKDHIEKRKSSDTYEDMATDI